MAFRMRLKPSRKSEALHAYREGGGAAADSGSQQTSASVGSRSIRSDAFVTGNGLHLRPDKRFNSLRYVLKATGLHHPYKHTDVPFLCLMCSR